MRRETDFSDLAHSSGEWLRGTGPESDIVISSRIRLARNLADFPFIRRCSDEDRISIERTVRARMEFASTIGKISATSTSSSFRKSTDSFLSNDN